MDLFLGNLSMTGAINIGSITLGIIDEINKNADNNVDPVSSNTNRLNGRLIACPPIADIMVPRIIKVKSLDHTLLLSTPPTPLVIYFLLLF